MPLEAAGHERPGQPAVISATCFTSAITAGNTSPRTGRPPAPPLELHTVFLNFLRTTEVQSGISRLQLFERCGACSLRGALNILQGEAKQTPPSLAAVNIVATLIGCPHDMVVVGLDLPSVPADVLVPILDKIESEVLTPFAKGFAIRRKLALAR